MEKLEILENRLKSDLLRHKNFLEEEKNFPIRGYLIGDIETLKYVLKLIEDIKKEKE